MSISEYVWYVNIGQLFPYAVAQLVQEFVHLINSENAFGDGRPQSHDLIQDRREIPRRFLSQNSMRM